MFRKNKHKYGATRVSHAGYSFASKLEASVFQMLTLMERAGEIAEIQVQDTVYLTDARIQFIPDFKVKNLKTGEYEWHEAKGIATPQFQIKRKLWMYYGPGLLNIWKGTWIKPVLIETITPKG